MYVGVQLFFKSIVKTIVIMLLDISSLYKLFRLSVERIIISFIISLYICFVFGPSYKLLLCFYNFSYYLSTHTYIFIITQH